jgi:hypothetical protein
MKLLVVCCTGIRADIEAIIILNAMPPNWIQINNNSYTRATTVRQPFFEHYVIHNKQPSYV